MPRTTRKGSGMRRAARVPDGGRTASATRATGTTLERRPGTTWPRAAHRAAGYRPQPRRCKEDTQMINI
ncbi:MAG: hypothetical protein ACJ8AG_01215, partial [Ktedonobacteraceae bacterium]